MTDLSEEQKLNERIRLMTLDELLANPNLPIEKYNQYAIMKGQILKALKTLPKKSFMRTKTFALILGSLLVFSCLSAGALYTVETTKYSTHYFVTTGTIIQSPMTGTSSTSQTNMTPTNPP